MTFLCKKSIFLNKKNQKINKFHNISKKHNKIETIQKKKL